MRIVYIHPDRSNRVSNKISDSFGAQWLRVFWNIHDKVEVANPMLAIRDRLEDEFK